nr:hypothetical protein [Bacteroidaceae bacterium]
EIQEYHYVASSDGQVENKDVLPLKTVFSDDGKLVVKEEDSYDSGSDKTIRNSEGFIENIVYANGRREEHYTYENGLLASISTVKKSSGILVEKRLQQFSYKDGDIFEQKIEGKKYDMPYSSVITYKIMERDEYGNWTKMFATSTKKSYEPLRTKDTDDDEDTKVRYDSIVDKSYYVYERKVEYF